MLLKTGFKLKVYTFGCPLCHKFGYLANNHYLCEKLTNNFQTTMNKQQLASKIWAAANKMRSKIEANEYKDYILGFIFYKFLSTEEEKFLLSKGWSSDTINTVEETDAGVVGYVQSNLGYFIGYSHLFSTWLAQGDNFGVKNATEALSAFNRLISSTHEKVFRGIFDTLQTGLSKLGESDAARSRAISQLLQLIKDIPMDAGQGYDVLGYIYEYLISNFAATAGKKAGEFYTPHEVSVLMADIVAHHLRNREKIEIYDPTSGSGSLLITIGRAVAKHIANPDNIKYYAQELKRNTYNLTRMNLVMRGIRPANIVTRNGDTLAPNSDWPYFDENDTQRAAGPSYNLVRMDAVVSNPPYSQSWDRPNDNNQDTRYQDYGLAPKKKADYAFLLHDLAHIKPDGIMAIVLPHGVLFRPGDEQEIRKNLIEHNNIDAIIGLPADIFFGTPIATIIMVLRQTRREGDVLFIDASKYACKDGKKKRLRSSDIKRIFDAVISRPKEIEKFARLVSRDEIRRNDYDLNIPKYVDSSEPVEHYDLYASLLGGIPKAEIALMDKWWQVMPALRDDLFQGDDYAQCITSDVATLIDGHADVKAYRQLFRTAFEGYEQWLTSEFIGKMMQLSTVRELDVLSADLFARLQHVPLINRYDAFQDLDDCWQQVAADLELLQQEGIEVLRQVEENMVVKKDSKNGEEFEAQQGWRGRIFPFPLVQKTFLGKELENIERLQERLSAIVARGEELLEEAIESEATFLNEDGDKIDAKLLKAEYKKAMNEHRKDDLEVRIYNNGEAEKKAKRDIRTASDTLEHHTIATIEALTKAQIDQLLHLKWITPITDALEARKEKVITDLTTAVKALAAKYATTFAEVERGIETTEAEIHTMLSDLCGSETDMQAINELKNMLKR